MDNSTNNISEKLVQYLDGNLPGREGDELERELATNEGLRDELENLKLTREAIRAYGLKQNVAGIHARMMKEMQTPVRKISNNRRIIRFSIAIAAGILLVFFASRLFFTETISSEKLFAANYRSYELTTVRRMETETAIEKAYRTKDYNSVIVLTDTSTGVKNLFLSAMSCLEMKKPSEAVLKFKKILQINEATGATTFTEESEYYMALAFILDKQYDFAAGLLQKIKDNPVHLYHEKISNKLIQDIKKLK